MLIVCEDDSLRSELHSLISFSLESSLSSLRLLPSVDNLVVCVSDLYDPNIRTAIRHLMGHAEKNIRLAVVKREWQEYEKEKLADIIRTEYRTADDATQRAMDKVSNLRENRWKTDRVRQLLEWRSVPNIEYSTFEMTPMLKNLLSDYFSNFVMMSSPDTPVTNKPPVLHWTPLPLDGEMQIVLRLSFFSSSLDESTYRDMCRSLSSSSDHAYEWTGGILLTSDPVRLHMERVSDSCIEIAGRVSVEELEDDVSDKPARLIWPFLSLALRTSLNTLRDHPNLHYSIEIIPFGELFFQPELNRRMFELTQLASTSTQHGKVAFRFRNDLYYIVLDQLFPDGVYGSLEELLSLQPPSPKLSRPESGLDSITALTPEPSPSVGLSVTHNRGRRVSFGSIKLMQDSSMNNGTEKEKSNSVDDYVDAMLKQTMDQIVSS